MDIEIWKDILGYVGLYQISNLGRVKSVQRKVPFYGGFRTYPEKIKVLEDLKGYKRVNLYKNSKLKKFLVHRLVAETLLGEQDETMQVNHINGITSDNRVENLEWTTVQENAHHKTTVLNKKPRGV
ncbi:NUMOD4 motif-containing HNH endonuclease [Heyndrickxia sp. NPDC080065]|uniref:NUMOD4 motif-containing HNH endonuclease n=1 Tax=Heyndrickxia sp. NPDC080065 TaxID=3390568 RepID=UPI003D03F581